MRGHSMSTDSPSGHAARDRAAPAADGRGPDTTSTLIAAPSAGAGFLDAPRLEPADLAIAIGEAFEALGRDGVLTVFSAHDHSRDAIEACCASGAIELVTTISHPGRGTAYTLRRAG